MTKIKLNREDSQAFIELLDKPVKISDRLLKAAKAHRELINNKSKEV